MIRTRIGQTTLTFSTRTKMSHTDSDDTPRWYYTRCAALLIQSPQRTRFYWLPLSRKVVT